VKKLYIYLSALFIFSCSMESNENKIGIVIHGGAGTILKEKHDARIREFIYD
jgi:hypothetical protein